MDSHTTLITFVSASALGVVLLLIANQLKISAIVTLLIGGILAGPEFLGIIQPASLGSGLNTIISLAVSLILFEGGLHLKIKHYKQVSKEIWSIMTKGLLITWGVTAIIIHLVFGFEPLFCILASSLIIVTGPTVIGPLLKRIRVQKKLHYILYWEGVLIDPIGVFVALLSYDLVLSSGSQEIFFGFLNRFIVGITIGIAFGYGIYYTLKKNWIAEDKLNIFVLTMAMLCFTVSDIISSESGLLSVTIAGFILGYKDAPLLDRIIEYKVELKDFLIGLLFMLLAANLKLQIFLDYGFPLLFVVILIMLLVRPLNIFLSMWDSSLNLNEKLFLSWIAPRGIVAASMTSLFAFRLREQGFENADFLEALTYAVIAGTVLFQGFTAKPMGKILKILEPRPKGWLIIGAHQLARSVGMFLQMHDQSVVILDTNPSEIKLANRDKLIAFCEDAMAVDPDSHIELYGVGNVLAITENEDLNKLLCQRWSKIFPNANLFRCGHDDQESSKESSRIKVGMVIWQDLHLKTVLAKGVKTGDLNISMKELPYEKAQRKSQILLVGNGDNFFPILKDNEKTNNPVRVLYLKGENNNKAINIKKAWIIITEQENLNQIFDQMLKTIKNDFPNLKYDKILKELIHRENEFSSLIGHGIALPHTYISSISEPIVILAKLNSPLMCPHTNSDIKFIFLVLSPENRSTAHLNQISKIAKIVTKEENRKALFEAADASKIFQLVSNLKSPEV